MDQKGESNVPISPDAADLPTQKRPKSTQIEISGRFSLSINESHYSNENEAFRFIEEIILPYIRKEREKLGCLNQKALLIFDVFRGQNTDKILKVLKDNNILATKVPPNMTHLFQPLDLTVNKVAKDFTKKKFSEWFSRQISIGLENGQKLEDIEIDYRFSVLKLLHATWLISFYDYISSPEGKAVIASGWKKIRYF